MLWRLERLSGVQTSLLLSLESPFTVLVAVLIVANIWPDSNLPAFSRFSLALRVPSQQFKNNSFLTGLH